MQKRSKNSAKRAPELHQFSHFFLPFDAPQAGSMALGIHGADSNAQNMAFERGSEAADRERPHAQIDRQYQLLWFIAFRSKAAQARKKMAI
jgi:hypothetical protein